MTDIPWTNPDFESGIEGWTAWNNAVLTHEPTGGTGGTGGMRVKTVATTGAVCGTYAYAALSDTTLRAGNPYTITVDIIVHINPNGEWLVVDVYDDVTTEDLNESIPVDIGPNTVSFTFTPTQDMSACSVGFYGGITGGFEFTVDNVRVTEHLVTPLPEPTFSAIGNARIEIYGPNTDAAAWDVAQWDVDVWAGMGWRDVTPESMAVQIDWGADDPAGVLTVPAAGSWQVDTYDPERKLDPSNGQSVFAASLKPGRPVRIVYDNKDTGTYRVVRTGIIDEVSYDLMEKTGSIRGSDGVALMANAKLPPGTQSNPDMPKTLRARTQWLLDISGMSQLITVEGKDDYRTIVRESRPVAYWRMGDAVGSTQVRDDYSQYHLDAAGCTFGSKGLIADVDTAVWLDGVDDKITGIVPAIFGAGAWSIEVWFKLDALPNGTSQWRAMLFTNETGGPSLAVTESGNIVIGQTGGAEVWYSTVKVEPTFTYHVVAICDGVNVQCWVDGQADNGPSAAPAFTDGATGAIGSKYAGGDRVNGTIDEVVLYERALTQQDAALHFTYGNGVFGGQDPTVGPLSRPLEDGAAEPEMNVWAAITTSAYDALYGVWMDRLGVLRFRSFGEPVDNGLQLGGAEGIPIETLQTNASIQNVYAGVVAYDETAPDQPVAISNPTTLQIYGDVILRRQKPVPYAEQWVERVLLDRQGASLQYLPGTIYPTSEEQLLSLLDIGMAEIVTMVAEQVNPPVSIASRLLGGSIFVDTGAGWTFNVTSYIPADEWTAIEEPPEVIPPDPPQGTETVTLDFTCTQDTRCSRTSAGNEWGAGQDPGHAIPIGAWQGWRNRAFYKFQKIDFTGVLEIKSAQLLLDTTTQDNVGFGSTPKVISKRITKDWQEGPYGSNGNVSDNSPGPNYPGPAVTNSGSKTHSHGRAENNPVALDVSAIVKAWLNGSKQYGIGLFSAGEDSTKYTIEYFDRTHGTAGKRPILRVTMKRALP